MSQIRPIYHANQSVRVEDNKCTEFVCGCWMILAGWQRCFWAQRGAAGGSHLAEQLHKAWEWILAGEVLVSPIAIN